MTNIVQRNLQRSLAKTVSQMEEETGLSQEDILNAMNDEYEYVPEDNPEAMRDLNKQVELDKAADDHARKSKLVLPKKSVIKTVMDRETGKLKADLTDDKGDHMLRGD